MKLITRVEIWVRITKVINHLARLSLLSLRGR